MVLSSRKKIFFTRKVQLPKICLDCMISNRIPYTNTDCELLSAPKTQLYKKVI